LLDRALVLPLSRQVAKAAVDAEPGRDLVPSCDAPVLADCLVKSAS
jgi:hypothetical protein